ncbi:MAG TPA: DUF975 family protein [Candidatus Acidoferrum sp.]|nr:DUF975 family protein [Candidatus Acidoferrum sp.]
MDKGQIRRNIKELAKRMLKGGRGLALLVLLLPALISLGFTALDKLVAIGLGYAPATPLEVLMLDWRYSLLSTLLSIGGMLISIPLAFGVRDWYVELGAGNKETLGYVFGWFSTTQRFWRAIGQTLLIGLRSFLWALLFAVPLVAAMAGAVFSGMFVLTGTDMWRYGYDPEYVLAALGVLWPVILLYLAWCAVVGIWLMRYAAAPYILVRHPDWSVRESISESIAVMRGHRIEYAVFTLSFFGWFLLAPFTLGLLLLWLLPYFFESTALFFQYVEDAYSIPGAAGPLDQTNITEGTDTHE